MSGKYTNITSYNKVRFNSSKNSTNRKAIYFYSFISILFLISCFNEDSQSKSIQDSPFYNPAAEGFDLENSDPKAILIADSVMHAMGGRKNWDETNFIRWNFFGVRTLLWDKKNKLVRIDAEKDNYKAIVHLENDFGSIQKNGQVYTNQDSLKIYKNKAKSIWINDAYWLIMPFKLKDSGVVLKYIDEGTTEEGKNAHILELRFKEVGNTPENKYRVWVDKKDYLVSQWSFYQTADLEEPRFITPWGKYQPHGNILLSGYRGPDYILTEIEVFDTLPPIYENAFVEFSEE